MIDADTIITVTNWGLRAAAILLLAMIAVGDFRTHKIRNTHVVTLLGIALAMLVNEALAHQASQPAMIAVGASAALFVVLFLFWLGGKVGAGDVKLLSIVPMLVGIDAMLPMALAMLGFSLVTFLLMRFPVLLPERAFRSYIESMDATGRVPFGVPISAAAILVLLLGPIITR